MKPGRSPGRRAAMDPVRDASTVGIDLSPAQADRLRRYRELLLDRALPMGMVARGDADRIYHRHILDSLSAAAAFRPSDSLAYDLGSGAGLPGIVLAIAFPGVRFLLVESRSRRAGFLELAAEDLRLGNVEVLRSRVEDLRDGGDVATARAFAPLDRSCELARRLLRPGGRLIYFAGRGLRDPERRAREMRGWEDVSVERVLDSSSALVIMSRT